MINLLKSRLLVINFGSILRFLLIINMPIATLLLLSVIFITLIMIIGEFIKKRLLIINFELIFRFLLIINVPIATLLLPVIFITLIMIIGEFIKIKIAHNKF